MPFDQSPAELLATPDNLKFDIMTVPVSDILKEGMAIGTNKYALVDNVGNVLNLMSNRYSYLMHEEAENAQNEVLLSSGLNLDGMTVNREYTSNGARLKRYITLPNEVIQPVVGDVMQFGIELFNSYDSSYPFEQTTKAFRLWCLNGCTTPLHTYNTRRKHTTNISIEGEGAKLALGVEAFYDSEGRYQAWSKQRLLTSQVERLFKATIVKKDGGKFPYTVKTFDNLMQEWQRTSITMGRNVWTAYNVATAWASHIRSDSGSFAENTRRQRHAKVAQMLTHDLWKEMEEG